MSCSRKYLLVLVVAMLPGRGTRVAAQFRVSGRLGAVERRRGQQMVLQVSFAKLALRLRDGRGGGFQAFRADGAVCELAVEFALLLDEPAANQSRFRLHRGNHL